MTTEDDRSAADETFTRVVFVTGFHRSGTTVVASAVTEASGGATLTVGHLAHHIPSIDHLLHTIQAGEASPDRGVDRLPVTDTMPEEYGWLLYHETGEHALRAPAVRSGIIAKLVDEIAGDTGAPVVVLKNPWDTGQEPLLLDHLPGARVLLVRRELGAIEASIGRALARYATSDGYLRALMGHDENVAKLLAALAKRHTRAIVVGSARWRLRLSALKLARTARRLPPERVAYLDYDELRRDPQAGAAWAAHLIDPVALGESFARLAFPEPAPARKDGWLVRAIDAYWARAWRRARAAQAKARPVTSA